MSPLRILILYGTKYGQTAKIATRMGEVLRGAGHEVTIVDSMGGSPSPAVFDGVIIGASVVAVGHQKRVERYVRRHVDTLNAMPSAFFSVSASAASTNSTGCRNARRVLERFLLATDWRPEEQACIAGAVNYTRYHPLVRWYMRWASKLGGGSTDTSRDHEYTDWVQVERFTLRFASVVSATIERRLSFAGRV